MNAVQIASLLIEAPSPNDDEVRRLVDKSTLILLRARLRRSLAQRGWSLDEFESAARTVTLWVSKPGTNYWRFEDECELERLVLRVVDPERTRRLTYYATWEWMFDQYKIKILFEIDLPSTFAKAPKRKA